MIRWTQLGARSAMLTLTVVCAAAAAPLAAQQSQNDQAITATTPPSSAPAVTATSEASTPATQAAGPRVNRMDRVEPKLNTPTRFAAQENVNVSNSYLIYILVAAVLVVLLIFLIKRA